MTMIEIKIDSSMNKSIYLKVNSNNRRELATELYHLFEAFMQSECKSQFMSAFLAYLEANEELLDVFQKHHNSVEWEVAEKLINKIFGDDK